MNIAGRTRRESFRYFVPDAWLQSAFEKVPMAG